MKLTKSEKQVLVSLRTNFYGDCGQSETWSWAVAEASIPPTISPNSIPGVVSSLKKKGLTKSYHDGSDSTTTLTDEGFYVATMLLPDEYLRIRTYNQFERNGRDVRDVVDISLINEITQDLSI